MDSGQMHQFLQAEAPVLPQLSYPQAKRKERTQLYAIRHSSALLSRAVPNSFAEIR